MNSQSAPRLRLVLDRLANVQAFGREWLARCPVCTGPEPLRISQDRAGAIVVKCEGGCAPADVARAVGLTLGELREPAAATVAAPKAANGAAPVDAEPAGLPRATCALHLPEPEPVTWVVKDFLPAREFALFFGDDGAMKTTIALHVCCAVAGGYRLFNRFDTASDEHPDGRPVLVVSQEDPAGVLVNRAEAMCRGHGWNRDAVLGNLHLLALEGASLSLPAWRAHLVAEVERLGAALVLLDPLAELAEGNENDNSERRAVVQAVRSLTLPTDAAVLLCHHAGKPSDGKRTKDRVRGASAVPAASRASFFLEMQEPDAGAPEHGPVSVTIACTKFSRGEKLKPFVVRAVIQSDPANRATWTTARLEGVSVREATLDAAEVFILGRLGSNGGVRLTTTDLKAAAKGTGVSGADIARALKVLEASRRITYEPGEKNAKLWGLADGMAPSPSVLRDDSEDESHGAHPNDFWLPGKQNGGPNPNGNVVARQPD